MLLFLFGSKDDLVRALLARARQDEYGLVDELRASRSADLRAVANRVWTWLAAPEHRGLLVLWTESYAGALVAPDGVWGAFASETVRDWLVLLSEAQPVQERDTSAGVARRTLVLAALRGAMLDLLATGEQARTTAAVELAISLAIDA